jgi:C4-dicarboxylate-specific signal transduction histidine kinase
MTEGLEDVSRSTKWIATFRERLAGAGAHTGIRARVSSVVEKAVAAVKFDPDGQNVSITVGKFPPAEADIDARNLESAIYNLLLNACQAATRSTHVAEVKIDLTEVDEQICVTISDNGPSIPAPVRRTLFNPFVTAGNPTEQDLALPWLVE